MSVAALVTVAGIACPEGALWTIEYLGYQKVPSWREYAGGASFCIAGARPAQTLRNHSIRNMKKKAVFYHAGCPVCVNAEQSVLSALDKNKFDVEVVHLGTAKSRVTEAEKLGVKSVPALSLEGQIFHINFGASLSALK